MKHTILFSSLAAVISLNSEAGETPAKTADLWNTVTQTGFHLSFIPKINNGNSNGILV